MSSGKEGVLVVGPVTEASSKYEALESMPLIDVLRGINAEDKLVPLAIEKKGKRNTGGRHFERKGFFGEMTKGDVVLRETLFLERQNPF